MLNKEGQRELAYIIKIDEIKPIEGADKVEVAVVNGWRIMVRKGQFQPGDLAVYFEIDAQVPEKEPFMFLAQKHFKIKTQKYFKGTVISQGLLMSFEDFGWSADQHKLGDFVTEELGVTYADAEDNTRKANSVDRYKKMAQRHGKLFSKQPYRWLMRREWGKKLLFLFYGRKKDKKTGWPEWVKKTDEERIQNMPWILESGEKWIVTEKIDGTSTSFTMKRHGKRKFDFYVMSRNVVFDKPDKACFYESNVYLEMAEKYHIEEVLRNFLMEHPAAEWVTLQGETYGKSIQKREYGIDDHAFAGFNLITSNEGRWNSVKAEEAMSKYGIDWVPILEINFELPKTVDEMLAYAGRFASELDGGMREGVVVRSQDGAQSFKAVSNAFLLKYHG